MMMMMIITGSMQQEPMHGRGRMHGWFTHGQAIEQFVRSEFHSLESKIIPRGKKACAQLARWMNGWISE